MNPLVSVILPSYNHAQFLEKRISTIINQTHHNFELILLDDASTDNSLNLLQDYKDHPKVSNFIVNDTNSGSPFKQWQKGLKLAKGDYVWIAESDDYCDLDFIEKHLENIGNAAASVAQTIIVSSNKVTSQSLDHPGLKKIADCRRRLQKKHFKSCPISNVSGVLFKNDSVLKSRNLSFASYKIIGDLMFYYECLFSKEVVFNKYTTSYFRQEPSSVSNLNSKPLTYFYQYLNEHIKFAEIVFSDKYDRENRVQYIRKKFYKFKNRKSLKKNLSLRYIKIYLLYIYNTVGFKF